MLRLLFLFFIVFLSTATHSMDDSINRILNYVLPLDMQEQLSKKELEALEDEKYTIQKRLIKLKIKDENIIERYLHLCPLLFSQQLDINETRKKIENLELDDAFTFLQFVDQKAISLSEVDRNHFLEGCSKGGNFDNNFMKRKRFCYDIFKKIEQQGQANKDERISKELEEILKSEKITYSKEEILKNLTVNIMWIKPHVETKYGLELYLLKENENADATHMPALKKQGNEYILFVRKKYGVVSIPLKPHDLGIDVEALDALWKNENNHRHNNDRTTYVVLDYENKIKDILLVKAGHAADGFIFPNPYKREKDIDVFERIKVWATHYPVVVVWYDSKTLAPTPKESQELVENTQGRIHDVLGELGKKVHLLDIRILETVKEHPGTFTEGADNYFRSDLLRIIASYEKLKNRPLGSFFLYADLSLDPNDFLPDFVLDPITVSNLNYYAIVVAANDAKVYENQFHIMGNHKPHLLEAIKAALIDLNLKRSKDPSFQKYSRTSATAQVVYDSYPCMFAVFYGLENLIEITNPEWKEVHNEQSLENYLYAISKGAGVMGTMPKTGKIESKMLYLQSALQKHKKTVFIPTKEGKYPQSRHG
jgi:hypothetical protein